jgi:uroporphyrinogen-III synthase
MTCARAAQRKSSLRLANKALEGRGIVVTRPRDLAAGLAARIEAAGGRALVYPAIEIQDLPDPRAALEAIDRLDSFDLAVFVSPTAVRKAFALIGTVRRRPWPAQLVAAGVGAATRAELEAAGVKSVLAPQERADSEALLDLPELSDVAGKRIVIFRGEGGREALGEGFLARGARVEYAACYRRTKPETDVQPLLAAWRRGEVHAVTVSSSSGLRNLAALLGAPGRGFIEALPFFVPHERVAEEARRLNAGAALIAGPTNDEMLARLVAYFERP